MSAIVQLSKEKFEYLQRLADTFGGSYEEVMAIQRVERSALGMVDPVAQYHAYMKTVDGLRLSQDVATQMAWAEANASLKAVPAGDVHQNATLSNMSVQYANEEFIGTQLLPVLPVAKESDIYYIYPKRERLNYPDDQMSDRGQAREIHETRTTDNYICKQFGYSNFVAARTLANQDAPLDEMVDLVESINEGLAFRREKRISVIMNASGNFGANTSAIIAAERWDTPAGGDPIKVIQDMKAEIWQGRGASTLKAYSSLGVYNVLSRHQQILDLFKYNGSSPGLATPSMIVGFLGIPEYLIGQAREETANEAAVASYSRLWGDNFGIVRVAQRMSKRNAVFGYTLRHGPSLTGVEYDKFKGHGGGYTAQVSVSEVHKVVAEDTGYLKETVIG